MKKDHLFWIYPVIYLGLVVIAINWDKSDMVTSAAENDDSKLYATETTDMQNRISGNLESGNQDYNSSARSLLPGNIPEKPVQSVYSLSGKYDSMRITADSLLYSWFEFENDMPDPLPDTVVAID